MQSLVSGLFASRILFAAAEGTAQSGMSSPEPVKVKGFEAATGARLNINRVPFSGNFENFFSDLSSRSDKYASSIAGAWWLGELVGGDHLLSYDKCHNDPRFPKWDIDDVLTAPRSLLSYGGKKFESPGHVRALAALVDLVQFGPKEMFNWDLGKSRDHFLAGHAAITFTRGPAQQEGSKVKGKIGSAALPGTREYYSIARHKWGKTAQPNLVGHTTGGSWAGVISKYSKAPEATYYLLALMAPRGKSQVYAARGWNGVDPAVGRYLIFTRHRRPAADGS
jgi:hypothetical protein